MSGEGYVRGNADTAAVQCADLFGLCGRVEFTVLVAIVKQPSEVTEQAT